MHREGPFLVTMQKLDTNSKAKISKDGTECESASGQIENVKSDVKVKGGKWYFEAKMVTYGKFYFGWCSSKCAIQPNYYNGLGSDAESWGYDVTYPAVWNSGTSKNYGEYCSQGDIIGCLLDLEAKTISYYRNGKDLGVAFTGVNPGEGLHAAASIQSGQKCSFNFGKEAFKYSVTEAFPDVLPLHINLSKDQQKHLDKAFDTYKNIGIKMSESGETDDVIKGQGLVQYGEVLGIHDERDPGLMIVAWKLNARDKKVWEFSRESFVSGWAVNGCYDVDAMKKKLKHWKEELFSKAPAFKQFYFFVFDYLKEDRTVLSIDEVKLVWDMLGFNETKWPLMPKWLTYVEDKKSMTRDTWRLFLSFTLQYPKDLSSFNVDDCWPSMIDSFVEWTQGKDTTPNNKKK